MQQDLMELDKTKADASEDIKQQTIAMDVGAAADQQKIAAEKEAEAAKAQTAAINQGISGIIGGATMAAPLFSKNATAIKDMDPDTLKQFMGIVGGGGLGDIFTGSGT